MVVAFADWRRCKEVGNRTEGIWDVGEWSVSSDGWALYLLSN
jgi:hypothetical protein